MKLLLIFLSTFTFSTMILPAEKATLPRILVNLKNLKNTTPQVVHVFSYAGYAEFAPGNYIKGAPANATHFNKLVPGVNADTISIPQGEGSIPHVAVRLVRESNLQSCIDLHAFVFPLPDESTLYISANARCMQKKGEQEISATLALNELIWKTKNPPSRITIEMEGTVGNSWKDAEMIIKRSIVS